VSVRSPSPSRRHAHALRAHPLLLAGLACAAVAALSLLRFRTQAYDPTAWLIWGRQITEGTLETIRGPSWKPLPVVVTAPSALLGDTAAPLIWAWVARTGGLMSIVLAYVVAVRLRGVLAGVVAVAALVLANSYLTNFLKGNSEGLLVALVLAAVLCQMDGRSRAAFVFGVGAGLLRPEAWPIIAAQGLWLLHEDRRRGASPWATLMLLGGTAVLLLVAWFVPEKIGSGNFLRGAQRGLEPVANSPALAAFPFGAVFTNGASALAYPVYAGAVLAVVDAVRHRRVAVLLVAAVATVWMVVVAALSQVGFTGNLRYVTLPAALLCVLGGVGWAIAARWRPRALVVVLVVAAVPGIVKAADGAAYQFDVLASDERLYRQLPAVIERAGGAAAIRDCGGAYTGPFQTQVLAWQLHLRQVQVGLRPQAPGTIIARLGGGIANDQRFPVRLQTSQWVVRSSCALPGG
jgi:hypothetical protein